ncbi:MAG: hypothetical protein RLO51_16795 [Thalassobaculum sp.]|uniref:hypothetical protein n=1 Tax=Thalassobaculum sp. TaxID=2022740 RepID=UPI0032ED3816
MSAADLHAEMLAAEMALWKPVAFRWFKAKGFPMADLLDRAPGLGVSRVDWCGEFYQPIESGDPAVIVAVWVRPPVDLTAGTRSAGVLADLAAVDLKTGAVATRCGIAYALGEHLLERDTRPFRLRCHVDARAWLQAGGDGVCPLDWSTFTIRTSGEPGLNLLADTVRDGELIETRMRETLPALPRLMVRRAAA